MIIGPNYCWTSCRVRRDHLFINFINFSVKYFPESEFEKYHLGLKYDAERFNNSLLESKPNLIGVQRSNLPSEFDWRSHNVVTGVKNQVSCFTINFNF